MKILKMPDKQTEQFDLFVQQQLNQVDIDISRADEFAGSMQFPVSVEPAAKQSWWKTNFSGKRKYLSALILLIFLSGTTIFILDKPATRSEKQENATPVNKENGNNIQNNNNNQPTTDGITKNEHNIQTQTVQPVANENTQSSPANQAATQKPVTRSSKDIADKTNKIETSDNGNDGVKDITAMPLNKAAGDKQATAPKTDSLIVTAPEKKPPVKKDTIHVIW
jgi:hypothetical protein